jgi:hypothetical protein
VVSPHLEAMPPKQPSAALLGVVIVVRWLCYLAHHHVQNTIAETWAASAAAANKPSSPAPGTCYISEE